MEASFFIKISVMQFYSNLKQVYQMQPVSLEDLQSQIQQAFDKLPQEMIDSAIDAYKHRLHRCIEVEGKSVELSYAN